MLMILERECLDLSEAIEQLSEKQELLATLMEGKMRLQKVAPEEFQRQTFPGVERAGGAEDNRSIGAIGTQAQVGKTGKGKARMLQGWSRQGPKVVLGAFDSSSFGSCSPSLAHDADEAMSTSSWTSPAKWKERDC